MNIGVSERNLWTEEAKRKTNEYLSFVPVLQRQRDEWYVLTAYLESCSRGQYSFLLKRYRLSRTLAPVSLVSLFVQARSRVVHTFQRMAAIANENIHLYGIETAARVSRTSASTHRTASKREKMRTTLFLLFTCR